MWPHYKEEIALPLTPASCDFERRLELLLAILGGDWDLLAARLGGEVDMLAVRLGAEVLLGFGCCETVRIPAWDLLACYENRVHC